MNSLLIFAGQYLCWVILALAFVYFLKQPLKTKKQMAALALLSLPIVYIAAKVTGHFYNDPRPFVVGNFTPLIPHQADNGFPSDHSLLSAAIASIIFCFNKKVSLGFWFLTLIVGFSRVLAGIHHSIDILGSITIAFIVTQFIFLLLQKLSIFSFIDKELTPK